MDADGLGDRKRKETKKKQQINECRKEKKGDFESKKKKKGDFEVVRCKNVFPGNIKTQFPTPFNTFSLPFEDEVYHATKHTYPPGMKKKNRVKIVKGMRLEKDIITLLSNDGKRDYLVRNNGVRVPLLDSIAGKYLLVCCFAIPIETDTWEADLCRNMISAYSELKAADCNFEMVIVATIASANMVVNDGDDEAAFNRFFDAFPCLAVPFSDSESRDLLCYSLGLTTAGPSCSSLLLDPDQLVLQTDAECFILFGAAAFPFTTNHLDALHRQDGDIKLRLDFIEREMKSCKEAITSPWVPVPLEELLGGCHLLRRTGCMKKGKKKEEEDEDEVISVSELSKKKCVGLYLCYNGDFMPKVDELHKDCAAKNLEFEVVLVYIPFHSDTTEFINEVNLHLCKKKITSWWVMPFVDEVCRRLWRLCDHYREDNLVVLTDDGWGDLKGRFVIQEKGAYYPFTRKSFLEMYTLHFRSLTVESLLLNRLTTRCGNNYNVPVPVSVLKNKNVLLFFDGIGGKLYKLVCNCYNYIQKKYPGTRVVLVPYAASDYNYPDNPPSWLLFVPFEAARSVIRRIYVGNDVHLGPILVAFGKDGFLVSRDAQDRIRKRSLFKCTLRRELVQSLDEVLVFS